MNAKFQKPMSTHPRTRSSAHPIQETTVNSKNNKPTAASKPEAKPQKNKGQASKSKKSPSQSSKPKKQNATPEAPENQLVRLHDLVGLAVLNLPQGLREILGEEAYENCLEEVQKIGSTLIVREPNDVVYVRMPVLVREMPLDGPAQMYLDQLLAACESPASAPLARKKRRRA